MEYSNSKTYKLSKKEVGDAIVNYIGIFKEGMSFFPYRISKIGGLVNKTDKVYIELEYISKGSKTEEVKHAL